MIAWNDNSDLTARLLRASFNIILMFILIIFKSCAVSM